MAHPSPFEHVSMSDPPCPERQSLALFGPSPMRPRQGPASVVRHTQSPIDRPSIIPSTRLSQPNTNSSELSSAARLSAPDSQSFSDSNERLSSRVSQSSPPILGWGKSADTSPPKNIAEMLPSTQHHPSTKSKTEPTGKGFVAIQQSICCGDEECIEYPVSTLPSSMLPADDEELFKVLAATEPPLDSLTIEVPSIPYVFEVGPSHTGIVTVWDVLEGIYQKRDRFGKQWFQGLSGLSWTRQKLRVQLHLTDTD